MNYGELTAFILYFLSVLAIGIYVMLKNKNQGESGYFLGGRKMGKWVTALSAQASDMSGWLLMGFPGSILAFGFGKVWIAIGLAIGTYLNWLFVAKRLRNFSQVAGESITIPQYLNNRFKASGKTLQIVAAAIFFVCFTVYVASGFKAGAALFQTVFNFNNETLAMLIFGVIMIAYTFMGGFKAVCFTDFFQALLMLVALMFVPIFLAVTQNIDFAAVQAENANYYNLLPSGKLDWESISSILSGLAWGLGYCGMPHILVRFMSIKSGKLIKTSRRIASVWVLITLLMAVVVGIVGRVILPELVAENSELVFIKLVRLALPGFVAGICLSAILAAAMSTADSQLLVASSAFTCDIYKPIFRKNASEKEQLWVGRAVVMVLAIIAFFIAINPNSGSIMNLVENAWAGFGAAFGPVIILSLYWKRFTYKGAVAGMLAGGLTVILWIIFLSASTGIYELLPGFIVGLLACIIVTLLDKKPTKDVDELFDAALKLDDAEEKAESETAEAVSE
ncbi:MAG: sodium/proline symporter PutP [Christensenellales bacterium]